MCPFLLLFVRVTSVVKGGGLLFEHRPLDVSKLNLSVTRQQTTAIKSKYWEEKMTNVF